MYKETSAIILAGGQSRRFNYQDKGLIQWKETPLISHIIECLRPQVDDIVISCNRNFDNYRHFGYPLVHDALPNYQGPLAGVHSALPSTKHPLVLICPCDTPQLPSNLVDKLSEELINRKADAIYPVSGNQQHYLPALIRSNLLGSLSHYLKGKDKSMKGWYATLKTINVPFPDKNNFMNVNTPDIL